LLNQEIDHLNAKLNDQVKSSRDKTDLALQR
jgi:hypothetical protein